ncbi:ABC transporter permease [Rhizobium sp. ARZ01]|nr:ABC transporter permease [Rhizobium sp. ARZ01]
MSSRYSLPFYAVTWCALLFLMAPIFVVVPVSLTPTDFLAFPTDGLSLKHYGQLFLDPAWYRSMGQSILIGLGAAALATMVGTAAAIGASKLRSDLAMAVRVLAMLPLIVPPVVSALALYRSWVILGLFDSWAGTILAHAILGVPYVFITTSAALSRLDPKIEMAARNLGAGWAHTQLRVVLPNIRAGVLAGSVFAFIASWDELVVTLFITSRGIFTLPRRMWDGIRENISPTIAAIATILILFSLLLLLIMRLVGGRNEQ